MPTPEDDDDDDGEAGAGEAWGPTLPAGSLYDADPLSLPCSLSLEGVLRGATARSGVDRPICNHNAKNDVRGELWRKDVCEGL